VSPNAPIRAQRQAICAGVLPASVWPAGSFDHLVGAHEQ
jgi:hypothetical protein